MPHVPPRSIDLAYFGICSPRIFARVAHCLMKFRLSCVQSKLAFHGNSACAGRNNDCLREADGPAE